MQTAFGSIDGNEMVLFNGTDEAVPLIPFSPHQILVPWPNAGVLMALDALNNGGSTVRIYRYPLAAMQDERNGLLQVVAKVMTAGPDLVLHDDLGAPLVVNAETMAFSQTGSWMVAESLNGSFVRINLATLDVVAFAHSFGSQGSPGLLHSQVAVSDDGHYVAIANQESASLKVYDLTNCTPGNAQTPQRCVAYDYQSFVRQQIPNFQTAVQLRFVNEDLLSFESRTDDTTGSSVYELAPQASIRSLIDYLALGDSYTSGEGAFDYIAGTDTPDNMCHLSVHSYPVLLTRDLFGAEGGHSVACSGAVIHDVGNMGADYRGQVRQGASWQELQTGQAATLLDTIMSDFTPGYVAQQRFVGQYQPRITTVSIGGNDIGFGNILKRCVMPHVSLNPSANTCYNTYEDRVELTDLIDRTVARWTTLYQQLLAEAPGTQLYVVGYPQIASDKGSCALNVHLNKAEIAFSEELIDYLNGAISKAAAAAGAQYVDVSQALAGHRLCEAASYDVAVNGLTAGTDAGLLGINVFGKESYHPNALGHMLLEQAILKQTNNLSASDSGSAAQDSSAMLAAPKTGRAITNLVAGDSLTAPVAARGKSLAVAANGSADGLRAQSGYTIRLDGALGQVLGSVTSDGTGSIATSVILPIDTAPGGHTIDVVGTDNDGQPIDVTWPIYVPVNENDADGDGIPDSLDTCPGAVNSGHDSDQDGIDDVCDGLIGRPPASASGGTHNSGGAAITKAVSGGGTSPPMLGSPSKQSVSKTAPVKRSRQAGERHPLAATRQPAQLPGQQQGRLLMVSAPLRVFAWRCWLELLAIIWLMVFGVLYARRLVGTDTQTGRFPLQ